jgi:hypothetical protein
VNKYPSLFFVDGIFEVNHQVFLGSRSLQESAKKPAPAEVPERLLHQQGGFSIYFIPSVKAVFPVKVMSGFSPSDTIIAGS